MQTVFIIGDSTANAGEAPFYGWGSQLAAYVPQSIRVANHAASGRSSKSFWTEGLFDGVAKRLSPGDLLLIAFGHNDEKDDPARHTDPDSSFPQMLLRYIHAARSAEATPVLITSVSRCYFLDDGSLLYTHGEYPLAVRTLAGRENVPCIDLKRTTRALLQTLGPKEAETLFVHVAPGVYPHLPDGWHDKTHFNLHGAQTVAATVAEALSAQDLLRP